MYAEEIDPVTEAFLGNFALISCAIKLLLYETGGEAAFYGVQGEGTRRTAKKITDALQTRSLGVNKHPTGDPSTARFRNQLIAACVSEHRRTRKDRKGDIHCPEPHGSFPSRRHSHNPKRGNRLKR
jgi:hypothetical protein